MNFKFGIEHEVAFLRANGQFADFANTAFAELAAIVAQLPEYEQDYPQLRIGDAGIKRKRWYVEGFERFSLAGEVIDCPPKGIEIRTTVHESIEGAIAQLQESFQQLCQQALTAGFSPAFTRTAASLSPSHRSMPLKNSAAKARPRCRRPIFRC
jgi:hypothetical protein